MAIDLKGQLLEEATALADKTGVPLEGIVGLALKKGLLLVRREFDTQSINGQAGSQIQLKTRAEKEAFISENWEKMTDAELAQATGYSPLTVTQKRSWMGFSRGERGRPPNPKNQPLTAEEEKFIKDNVDKMKLFELYQRLGKKIAFIKKAVKEAQNQFIAKRYSQMDDGELARALGISRMSVFNKRRELGLSRQEIPRKSRGVKTEIDKEELRQALQEKGETLRGFIKKRNLGITHQRLRQICQDWGIKTGQANRKLSWYAHYYGKPELADKEWLEGQLKDEGGYMSLARRLQKEKIEISPQTISRLAQLLSIDLRIIKAQAPMVQLSCSFCGQKILRNKTLVRPAYRHAFCNRTCHGRYMAKKGAEARKRKLK